MLGETLVVDPRTTVKLHKCRLAVTSGPDTGRSVVSDKERLRCGAHPGNDLVLVEDRTASRHHFEIQFTERGYLLVDLGSTNGTFLDGRRIERAYLSPGSQIRAGSSVLTFAPLDEEVTIEPDREGELCDMVGQSVKMRQIFGLIKKIAPMGVSVIIQGETGTGKELVARAIHELSGRTKGPMEVLDCGAIPPNLIESELFGHEKGAFTGAVSSRPGAFERAHGGTIFLDELGELRLDLQPKLLRVLENHEVRRVGGNDVIEVDCRVIAATNRDLMKEIQGGGFREDLYFRLSVITIQLPPLRQRRDDIPLILKRALADPEVVGKHGKKRFSAESLGLLMSYSWPGNVRELMNVLSHVLTFSEGEEIQPAHLPPRVRGQVREGPLPFNEHLSFKDAKEQLLENFEREYITSVLTRCEGNLSRAARESGLHRKSIERLVKKYQLDTKGMKSR
ncbi:sigma-54-dependent Fis family transcriptional regulator [Myxococcus xanthus]|uniref:Sigma-54-dependent Fis family transcriptional regulator n=1 Tax=Myxococcus xanthus TaxID=34 RepID=A0AAF1D821_MYXXA|nr:sigma-54-dependent Fis family transcriptional regulator [Myxococcus xanthus]QDE73099.1 sigma-54-dependent Fis family transcriptional regulator [Myxococcus xanthus]QDE80377.1 sigma-54-dependent Fis family transcriptional regulator [Myxococcus xanthus]QDE94697.1 sigma-54-dependent Fis family transcriptional regulator [Myxococcus xanthus]QDF01931.1 sigma-54-dependent Fis family transcriptional regulator [Myxococcus xanthus]